MKPSRCAQAVILTPTSPSASRRRCHPAATRCPSVSCRRRARWSVCTARPAPACCCSSWPTACGWRACCSASTSSCWASTSLCEPHYPECTRTEPSRKAWRLMMIFFANVTLLPWTGPEKLFIQPWFICLNVSPDCDQHEHIYIDRYILNVL